MTAHRSFATLAFVAAATLVIALQVAPALVGVHVPGEIGRNSPAVARHDPAVSFRGDYESGDRSQWLWCFSEGAATCRVTTSPVRQGRYAAAFTTSPEQARGPTERAENVAYPGDTLGSESYYAWSTLFPRGFNTPSWANISQFFPRYYERLGCIQEHFVVGNSRPGPANALFLELCAGDMSTPGGVRTGGYKIQQGLNLGRWNDYVMHVVWTPRANGLLVVWHRVQGGTWRRALLYRGPTMLYKPGARHSIGVSEGLYRPRAAGPATIYQDGFVRGESFAAVTRAAFGTG